VRLSSVHGSALVSPSPSSVPSVRSPTAPPDHGLILQIAFRAIVYGGLFVVIDRYFRPASAVPLVLTGLLGTVGIASMVGRPDRLAGHKATSHAGLVGSFVAFAAIRCVHLSG